MMALCDAVSVADATGIEEHVKQMEFQLSLERISKEREEIAFAREQLQAKREEFRKVSITTLDDVMDSCKKRRVEVQWTDAKYKGNIVDAIFKVEYDDGDVFWEQVCNTQSKAVSNCKRSQHCTKEHGHVGNGYKSTKEIMTPVVLPTTRCSYRAKSTPSFLGNNDGFFSTNAREWKGL